MQTCAFLLLLMRNAFFGINCYLKEKNLNFTTGELQQLKNICTMHVGC